MTAQRATAPWSRNNPNGIVRPAKSPALPPAPKLTDQSWRLRSACTEPGADVDLWFPAGDGAGFAPQIAGAKAVCNGRCPVREACLADAMEIVAEFGIRGGLTAAERKAMAEADAE